MKIVRSGWDGTNLAGEVARLRHRPAVGDDECSAQTAAIVAQVRDGGDAALRQLCARLDATELDPDAIELRVDPAAIAAARDEVSAELVGALEVAARNIQKVARAELAATGDVAAELPQGQTVSLGARAVRSAGIYVPGGRAAYPSSVLMGCVPARVAGVGRVAVASPPSANGRVHPAILAACAIAGVEELYALGGAQAIAALAYGTETIKRVDVIAGPGNSYVNAAKRLVFGEVGVDGIAGPSELVVVADDDADPRCLALDLLAQGEHGPDGLLVAIAGDREVLDRVEAELTALRAERPTVAASEVALVETPDLGAAIELADGLAPEHLELALEVADQQLARDRIAGSVFFGPLGAVAFGDYAAGSNHVLPTGGAARFSSPLGVRTFQSRTAVIEIPPAAAAGLAPRVAAMARAEGFDVHAESAEARTER